MDYPVRPWNRRRRGRGALIGTVTLVCVAGGAWGVRDVATLGLPGAQPSVAVAPRRPPLVTPNRLSPVAAVDARAVNAARPIADVPDPPASPFLYNGPNLARARDCLAAASWWEAGDDASGQAAVAQVVLNRVRHRAFPKTVCGVVWQGAERATGCQFTFACDGSLASRRPSPAAWVRAEAVAQTALAGRVVPEVGLATHYHTVDVLPVWSAQLLKVAAIGPHLFFRWPGYWGQRRAWLTVRQGEEPLIAALAPFSPAHANLLAPVGPPSPPTVVALSAVGVNYPREKPGDNSPVLAAPVGSGARNNRFQLVLGSDQSGGGWALQALRVCRGKPDCTVEGRVQSGQGMPDFVYRRTLDGDSAKWNCAVVQRPDPAQCLPGSAK